MWHWTRLKKHGLDLGARSITTPRWYSLLAQKKSRRLLADGDATGLAKTSPLLQLYLSWRQGPEEFLPYRHEKIYYRKDHRYGSVRQLRPKPIHPTSHYVGSPLSSAQYALHKARLCLALRIPVDIAAAADGRRTHILSCNELRREGSVEMPVDS